MPITRLAAAVYGPSKQHKVQTADQMFVGIRFYNYYYIILLCRTEIMFNPRDSSVRYDAVCIPTIPAIQSTYRHNIMM